MTGRRTHAGSGLSATPTGIRLVTPDLSRCTPAYGLGRVLGQLARVVAALLASASRTVAAAEL